jgi:hypothetical protein
MYVRFFINLKLSPHFLAVGNQSNDTMMKQIFALLALFAAASAFVPSSSAGM